MKNHHSSLPQVSAYCLTAVAACFLASSLPGNAAEPAKPAAPAVSTVNVDLLGSAKSPLRKTDKLAFFGDSITMQGGFINLIEKSIKEGTATKTSSIAISRHGLNGGRVPTVLEGKSPWGNMNGTMQEHIDKEKPTVLVIFLGVNDVEHGANGTNPADYRAGLEKMIGMGRKAGAVIVLCTPAVVGEQKLGTNRCDKGMDEYAAIVRDLAAKNKTALCDIRKAMFDYLATNNPENKTNGILTYDGIHLSPQGNAVVADLVAKGIASACAGRK
jgi:lysophospholipase L1-like esterase